MEAVSKICFKYKFSGFQLLKCMEIVVKADGK